MEVTHQFVHTEVKDGLEIAVNEKLDGLKEKFDWIVRAKVFYKEDRHDEERNCVFEVELSVPGNNVFAKANETSFEHAIAETFNELTRQLRKHKSKMYRHKL